MNENSKERISALLDDETSLSDVSGLSTDEAAKALFGRYAMIGEAIRGNAPDDIGDRLLKGVQADLAVEPVPLAPKRKSVVWKPIAGLALAASVATVAILGLRAVDGPTQPDLVAEQAVQPSSASNRWDVEQPAVEAKLNEYLVNHSEYTGYGVQGMLPYARIVSYDSSQ